MKTQHTSEQAKQQTLTQAQRKQNKQLKKTEDARDRLGKATQKLSKLESAITVLVQAQQSPKPQLPEQISPQPPELRRARVIFNPQSKGAINGTFHPDQILDCLRNYGIAGELTVKTSGKVARKLAKEAVKQGIDLVIVAGGDGTIEDVAGQLVGTETTLGIIPMGTMNNLARSLGIPLNLDDACALLRMGFTRHIDVGRIRTTDKPKGVYFLEMAGIGLSAHALPLSQDAKKGRWGKLLSSMGNAFASHIGTLTISYDDEAEFQAHTHVVTIANAPLFGENMFIGPDTKMDDGVLDVALYRDMSKFDLEQHFMAIASGKRVDDSRITFRHVRSIRVSASEPIVANADLEILAPQPTWEIAIVPCALAVVAGNGIGLTLPVESAVIVPPLAGPQPLLVIANGHAQPLSGEIAPLIS